MYFKLFILFGFFSAHCSSMNLSAQANDVVEPSVFNITVDNTQLHLYFESNELFSFSGGKYSESADSFLFDDAQGEKVWDKSFSAYLSYDPGYHSCGLDYKPYDKLWIIDDEMKFENIGFEEYAKYGPYLNHQDFFALHPGDKDARCCVSDGYSYKWIYADGRSLYT